MSRKPIRKILIANRGEIALRIIRTCHELGIETVAVYSTADQSSLHVKFAGESVCIGPPPPKESYLNPHRILSAAELTGADAIHPGYGFLSENAEFAELVASSGFRFVGPAAASMKLLSGKFDAKQIAIRAGVPTLPCADVTGVPDAQAIRAAAEIGYPILIKASNGGGGRGMRLVLHESDLPSALATARAESRAGFGSDHVYLEKFCERARHIEFQVMGDRYGNYRYFPERDCSLQRRHQKLLEESPSPGIGEELRRRMGEAAVALARAASYENLATVEFLYDPASKQFFFLEVNTRIQVEHPVTEMVTNLDLIQLQIEIASGEPIVLDQSEIGIHGHAIECRINAEHPETFQPSPGRITHFHAPGGLGVRLESVAYAGWNVPPQYDSLVAKLIVNAETRTRCIARLRQALTEFAVGGIDTTLALHLRLMGDERFVAGDIYTRYLQEEFLSNSNGLRSVLN